MKLIVSTLQLIVGILALVVLIKGLDTISPIICILLCLIGLYNGLKGYIALLKQ